MSLDDDQYSQLFIEEAREHIDNLTECLLALEKDPKNQDLVNTLFRSAHTLKGSSGMMGFKDFQALTHAMEDIFDSLRKGNQPTSSLISVLLECVDALSLRLKNIQNDVEGEIEVDQFKDKLNHTDNVLPSNEIEEKRVQLPCNPENSGLVELNDKEKKEIEEAENIGASAYFVELSFSKDCAYKTIRANMVLDKISDYAKVIKVVPKQEELDEEKLGLGLKIAIVSKSDQKSIERSVQQILEVEDVRVISPNDSSLPHKETPATIASENNYVVTLENGRVTKVIEDVHSTQTVRVKFDQLDKLMNWVGELVINKISLLQVTSDSQNEGLKRITENIDRLTADLQDLVMQVRMVPVSQIFDRFPRLVRDLSLKKGKKIELVMEGKEIEVDRTVLDEIGEPLIHLLRNSIDHGIEMPTERENAKKDPAGTIKLSAQRNGDHVIIEVEDDGAGIDPEKVKKSALKKGFSSEAELEKMGTDQLINLIFQPGFSTANEVTDTSGRGVGMDVVKTKISSLGGTVHLETRLGQGTITAIKLPLTLAIIQAILVNDSRQTFAIPTSQVSEIVQAKKSDVKSLGNTNAIVVRNHVIPVVHLHNLLGLEGYDEENLELLITYLGDENTKIGLVVDSVLRQQDILIKPLSETLQGIKGISGATILGDGQVVLVIDVGQFVQRKRKKVITEECEPIMH